MDKMTKSDNVDKSRRDFVKKSAYVTPAILTLTALPSFASSGSGMRYRRKGNEGVGNGYDPAPPGHYPTNYNDFEGTGPGRPGHRHPRRYLHPRR